MFNLITFNSKTGNKRFNDCAPVTRAGEHIPTTVGTAIRKRLFSGGKEIVA